MTLIRRPSPFGEFLALRHVVDRLFDDTFVRSMNGDERDATAMPLDVYTTKDALVVEAALPGVKPEDVQVSILGDTLTLNATSGSERTAEEGGYHVQEVRRGRFARTVTLPSGLRSDSATATFENGILRLWIPKAEQARPRQIRVTSPSEGAVQVGAGPDSGETPAAG